MSAEEIEQEIRIFKDSPLGSGSFGIVCKAKYDQLPCAAKLLHPTFVVPGNWAAEKFMQECQFLASLKHPHIVQFLGVHTEKSTGQAVLLMELMDESLTAFLKRHKSSNQLVPINIQVDISHDIALALHYLHTKGIIHRDLSSNNILLIGGCRAKITDFGMSKLTLNVSSSLSSLTQVPGCPVYMPPEAWISPPIYTEKLDIFSFGVLLIQIATCKQPNPGPSETLLPDERSPTGFLKLPVPEIKRRSEDIALIPSDHLLKDYAISCLNDKEDSRPCARVVCQFIDSIKTTHEYVSSSNLKSEAILSSVSPSSSGDSGYMDSSRLLAQSEEIKSLKMSVDTKEAKVSELEAQILDKDSVIKFLQKQLEGVKSSQKEVIAKSYQASSSILRSSVEQMTIHGLSPEILTVLENDSNIKHMFSVDYDRDNVTFYWHSQNDDKERRIKLFLQMYQRLFNSGQTRVSFIPVPTSFPKDMLDHVIGVCGREHSECIFTIIESIQTMKVLSKSSALNQVSCQLATDLLSLSIAIPGDRKLILKHNSVLDEKADVLVCGTQPNLSHNLGISLKMNAMSNFELQKHCNQYLQKNGPLQVGQVMHIPAAGTLQCDWVIHAVGPSSAYNDDKDLASTKAELDSIMRHLMATILERAEKLKARHMAMPLLGNLDPDHKLSSTAIVETVLSYKYHSLKEVVIAINDDRIYNSFLPILLNHGAYWTRRSYDSLATNISSSKSCKQQ